MEIKWESGCDQCCMYCIFPCNRCSSSCLTWNKYCYECELSKEMEEEHDKRK